MDIIKLDYTDTEILNKISKWNYNWWGKRNGESPEEVKSYMKHMVGNL